MAIPHGKDTRIYVDEFNISGDSNSVDPTFTTETAETQGMGGTAHKTRIAGQRDTKLSIASFFNAGTGNVEDVVTDYALAAETGTLTVCPDGVADSAPAYTVREAVCASMKPPAKLGAAVALAHDWEATSPADRELVIYEASPTGTATGAAIDFGSVGVALMGAAVIHCTSVTGSGTIDVHLHQSSDDGGGDPYADLTGGAFTQLTGVGHERITWAGACERYVKAVITIAGFTACTLLVVGKIGGTYA